MTHSSFSRSIFIVHPSYFCNGKDRCIVNTINNCLFVLAAPEEKAEPPQTMNALMRLNQLKPGLQYKLVSQTGPVHVPVFTMAVEVDGTTFEASGPSKRTAKLHVAVKVSRIPPQRIPIVHVYFQSHYIESLSSLKKKKKKQILGW